MKIFTIGFTRKSARRFFALLRESGARGIVDVRLNNVSQLSGFSKKDDLAYFLDEVCGMQYVHAPELAPTKELLDDYRKRRSDWRTYEARFLDLLRERRVEETVPRELVSDGCLFVQRGQAPPLPPAARGGIPETALGRCGHRPPRLRAGTRNQRGIATPGRSVARSGAPILPRDCTCLTSSISSAPLQKTGPCRTRQW